MNDGLVERRISSKSVCAPMSQVFYKISNNENVEQEVSKANVIRFLVQNGPCKLGDITSTLYPRVKNRSIIMQRLRSIIDDDFKFDGEIVRVSTTGQSSTLPLSEVILAPEPDTYDLVVLRNVAISVLTEVISEMSQLQLEDLLNRYRRKVKAVTLCISGLALGPIECTPELTFLNLKKNYPEVSKGFLTIKNKPWRDNIQISLMDSSEIVIATYIPCVFGGSSEVVIDLKPKKQRNPTKKSKKKVEVQAVKRVKHVERFLKKEAPEIRKPISKMPQKKSKSLSRSYFMFTLPYKAHDLVPVPIEGQIEAVALAAPFVDIPSSWYPASPTAVGLPTQDQLVRFLFRDVARSTVSYNPNPSPLGAWTYQATPSSGSNPIIFQNKTLQPIDACQMQAQSNYAPHGPVLFPGRTDKLNGANFFWMDSDSIVGPGTITLDVTSLSAGATYSWTVFRWDPEQDRVVEVVTLPETTSGNKIWPNSIGSGYFAVSVQITSSGGADSVSCTLAFNNNATSCWEHLPIPEFLQNLQNISRWKIDGLSLHYENDSDYQNMSGNYFQKQIPASIPWQNVANPTTGCQQLTTLADNRDGKLAVGCYSYLKPSSDEELKFTNNGVQGPNADSICQVHFQLENRSDYLVTFVQAGTPNDQKGLWKLGYTVEYITVNQWVNLVRPSSKINYRKLENKIAKADQFFDNENHIKQIFGFLKNRAAPKLLGYASTATDVISKVVPVIRLLSDIL